MSTLLTTPVVGLPEVQRAAFYVFFESFNTILSEVETYWVPFDEKFDEVTGRTTSPTVLEPIPNDNFHEGHKPSLVLGVPSNYPNLAVFATRASPSSENRSFDQFTSWSDSILVEIMVKALDEDTVNRRVQRATEAAVLSLTMNPTLGGAVMGLEDAPTVNISDVFAVSTNDEVAGGGDYGQRFVWQGSSMQWSVTKDSSPPGPDGDIFQKASTTDYSQFIDQG